MSSCLRAGFRYVSAQATFRNGCAALSPGDLTRARTDGITGPAACGVHGLGESGIHHDPLARFALASSGSAPAALPWALATGALSCCSPLAGRLRACGRLPSGGRRHGEQHSRGSQTERFRNERIGMAMISSLVSLPRGGKACALSASPKVVSHILSKGPWAVNGRQSRDQAAGGWVRSSTWNRADGSSPAQPATHVQPAGLGVRGRGILEEEPLGVPRGTRRHRARLSSDRLNGVRTMILPGAYLERPALHRARGAWASAGIEKKHCLERRGFPRTVVPIGHPDLGRSFLMRNSRCQIQLGQDHLRNIVGRWPFWASRAWALQRAGTERLRGSALRRRGHNRRSASLSEAP